MLFLTTTTATAANAVAAAHIQGLQAFMASEVKERATDAQLEAAAGVGQPRSTNVCPTWFDRC